MENSENDRSSDAERTDDNCKTEIDNGSTTNTESNTDTQVSRSKSTTSIKICRICYDEESTEPLKSPCKCRGTIGLVHISCLQKWLFITQEGSCEICHYKYETRHVKRYKLFESLPIWFRTAADHGQVLCDTLTLIVSTPIVVLGVFSAWTAIAYQSKGLYLGDFDKVPSSSETTITNLGLGLTGITLLFGYIAYVVNTFYFHCASWINWYERQTDITIIIEGDS